MINFNIENAPECIQILVDAIAPAFAKLAVASKSAAKIRQLMENDRFEKSEAVMNNDALSEDEKNLQLLDITLSHEERIKFCNLRTIFKKTEQYLGDTFDASNLVLSMSEDWKAQFKTFAEIKSDEHVQDLWARLLAGEIQNHGLFDFKTMQILSYLSSEDAKVLNALGHFTHSNGVIFLPMLPQGKELPGARDSKLTSLLTIFENYGVKKSTLITLADLDIISVFPSEYRDDDYMYNTHLVHTRQIAILDVITFSKHGKKLITLTDGYGASSFPAEYWEELTDYCADASFVEDINRHTGLEKLKLYLSNELYRAIKGNFKESNEAD